MAIDNPRAKIGILQASGVAIYVLGFTTLITRMENITPEPPEALAASVFLLAFIVSALVCGSLVLLYPILLALKGRVGEALEIIAWSALSLVVILLSVVLIILLSS